MASFPGSIYSVQNPTPSTSRAGGTTGPAEQVAALNGEVEAIETYIGTTGSPNLLPLAGGTMTGPISGFEDKGGQVYNALAYGMYCDDTHDDTAAFNSLLATVYTAGGGTIYLPGLALIGGQITMPMSAANPGRMPPIRIYSNGPDRVGYGVPSPYISGGLDLRYAGRTDTGCGTTLGSATVTDPSAVAGDIGFWVLHPNVPDRAQIISVSPGTGYTLSRNASANGSSLTFKVGGGRIQSFGSGYLELDHMLLTTGVGTSSMPFGWSTYTVVNMHDCSVVGTKAGNTCDEDIWIFGGTQIQVIGNSSELTPKAPFQGYGSRVNNNFFDRVRRLLGQAWVSSLWIEDNTWWQTTGSNLVNSTTLTSTLTNGNAYTSLAVVALTRAVVSGDNIQVGYTSKVSGSAQTFVASAAAAVGATSISVTSQNANANYAIGTVVTDTSSGLGAPVEFWGIPSNNSLPNLFHNRFEMSRGYTHVSIMDFCSIPTIIANEVQDSYPTNIGIHWVTASTENGLILPGYINSVGPIVDGPGAANTSLISSVIPSTFPGLQSFTPFRWTIEPPTTTETWAIGDPATNTWLQLQGNAFNVGSNLNLNGAASGTTRLTLGNGMLTTDAAITLQSPWTNSIAFNQSGVQHWMLYDGDSNLLIMRDMVNAWNVWVLYPGVGNNSQFALGCVFLPAQAVTTSAPSYVKGAMYFDTTLNKLRIGGVSAWETVTSA